MGVKSRDSLEYSTDNRASWEASSGRFETDCSKIILKDEAAAKRSHLRDFGRYSVKAFTLMVLLMMLGAFAPHLPAGLLIFAFLVYAVPATVGSMFNVVKNKIHKQDLYNEHGKLSGYNRRWLLWFGAFFVAYLISAAIFTLQAASWNGAAWLLMWVGAFGYYFVFLLIQSRLKKEFSVKYYKARAIKWSIIVTAVILAVLYTFMVSHPPTELNINLHEIVDNRYMPFAESPCSLLSVLDIVTTYVNQLTEYGLNKITGSSYAISVVVNLVLGFSAFVGIVSQFGACLLDKKEVRNEFQLLPANDGDPEGVVLKRYGILLIIIWMVVSGIFLFLDFRASEVRETDQYAAVKQWVDQTTDLIILATEEDIKTVKKEYESFEDAKAFEEEFVQKRDSYINTELGKLSESVEDYYGECESKVDDFIEWYDSIPGRAARWMPIFGEGIVRDEFIKRVVDQVDTTEVNEIYDEYLNGLKGLYDDHQNAGELKALPNSQINVSAEEVASAKGVPSKLDLWLAWESDAGRAFVTSVLLGQGDDEDAGEAKTRILNYIDERNGETQALITSLSNKFFSE